jgi:hypothetical protein
VSRQPACSREASQGEFSKHQATTPKSRSSSTQHRHAAESSRK